MDYLTNIWDKLMENVPNVIEALLLLIIAFICAAIVKGIVIKAMKLFKFGKNNEKNTLVNFCGKLTYLIIFALFVPGIFEKLGLNGIATPFISMSNKFFSFLPNIVAAAVILIVGLLIAKMIKELLIPILQKLKFDAFLKKAGFEENENVSIADVLANIVYVLILIPVVIASLDALKIDAISKPAIEMLNNILAFMPRIAIAIVILFVGKFIADLAAGLLENVLVSIGTDKLTQNVLKASGTKTEKEFSLSTIIARVVKYVIVIFFLVEGLNILKLEVLTNIGSKIIEYLPYALSSAIILGTAILVGNFVENSINNKFKDSNLTAMIVKVVIITVGAFMTLYQLGIAKSLVNGAFIIILSALAIAFAVSFGIGGKTFAAHMLDKLEKKLDDKKN